MVIRMVILIRMIMATRMLIHMVMSLLITDIRILTANRITDARMAIRMATLMDTVSRRPATWTSTSFSFATNARYKTSLLSNQKGVDKRLAAIRLLARPQNTVNERRQRLEQRNANIERCADIHVLR